VHTSVDVARLDAILLRMGFQAIAAIDSAGDIGIRFLNSKDLGRFVAEAVRLLSGDEVVRIGSGCLATLNRRAATLICDRAE
jgi:hypothetical protein